MLKRRGPAPVQRVDPFSLAGGLGADLQRGEGHRVHEHDAFPLPDVLAVGEGQAALELDLVDPVEAVEPIAQRPVGEVGLVEPAEQEDPGVGRRERLFVLDLRRLERAVLGDLLTELPDRLAHGVLDQQVAVAPLLLLVHLAARAVLGQAGRLDAGEPARVFAVDRGLPEQRLEADSSGRPQGRSESPRIESYWPRSSLGWRGGSGGGIGSGRPLCGSAACWNGKTVPAAAIDQISPSDSTFPMRRTRPF